MHEMDAGDLAAGDVVEIDGAPSLVRDLETSKPGKHGTAKVTVTAEGVFDGEQRSIAQPADAAVPVPDVESPRNPLVTVGGGGSGRDHFDPAIVRVDPGATVVWLWDDDETHEVAAVDGAFASDRTDGEGVTYEHTYAEPGIHRYRCGPHGGVGAVIVASADDDSE